MSQGMHHKQFVPVAVCSIRCERHVNCIAGWAFRPRFFDRARISKNVSHRMNRRSERHKGGRPREEVVVVAARGGGNSSQIYPYWAGICTLETTFEYPLSTLLESTAVVA